MATKEKLREFAFFTKSALFTIVIHGVLIAALLFGLWWPYSQNKAKRGSVEPIQAKVISPEEIQQVVDQQNKKLEDEKAKKQQFEEELALIKKQQEEEKKKLEQLEIKRQQEEQEKKQKEAQEKLKLEQAEEAEKKRRAEEEAKRKAEQEKLEKEKREKEEAEKKRKEAEKRNKAEEEKKRKAEEEKRAREKELKEQLEKEQLARTKAEAANALSSLVDRIAATVENNWRRPLNSSAGLKATIRVKVSRNGDVLSANVVKSSADPFFDKSAGLAVKKASPLPFPADPKYYEFIDEFDFLFNPDAF